MIAADAPAFSGILCQESGGIRSERDRLHWPAWEETMRSTPWLVGWLALLLLAGCPEYGDDFGSDDDDAADDDDTAASDDDTADDDTAEQPDDDTAGDDDSAEPGEEVDGALSLQYAEVPDHVGGMITHLTFSANFTEELVPGSGGVSFNAPEAVDECALTRYSWDDLQGGVPPDLEYQSAGTLTLTGTQGTFEIEPNAHGGITTYGLELTPGTDIDSGSSWDIAATGDAYPAFDYPAGLDLAGAVHLDSPTVTEYFEVTGELDLQWSGGTLPHVTIEIVDWVQEDDDNVYVHCWVHNDGSFTVPLELMDEFPADDIYLQLSQPTYEIRPAGDRWVGVGTGASAVSTGFKL
jgi:hypothetical protein